MDDLSEERLALVNPILADKVRILSNMLETERIIIRVVQGLRSWNEQQKLYEQGRTTPGKIVTQCPGGHSYHCFGMACDLAPNDPSKPIWTPDWNADHPSWKKIEAAAVSIGLVCGCAFRTFVDAPHAQMTGRFPVNPDEEVRQLFKAGGMEAIWREANF